MFKSHDRVQKLRTGNQTNKQYYVDKRIRIIRYAIKLLNARYQNNCRYKQSNSER